MPRQREDRQASHQYTYRGPATSFRVAEGAEPVAQGGKVTLTNAQVRALVRSGHRLAPEGQAAAAAIEAAEEAQRVERDRLEFLARQAKQGQQ